MLKTTASTRGVLALLVAVGIGIVSAAPAAAGETLNVTPDGKGGSLVSLPDKQGIPPEIRAAIQRTVESSAGEKINDLVWDAATSTLEVHVVGSNSPELEPILGEAFPGAYRFVQDEYSSAELSSLAYELANEGVASGVPIASVSPAKNNSGLIVTLVEGKTSKRNAPSDQKELQSMSVVPLRFESIGTAPQQANGWRWGDDSPFWGGARIYGPAGNACTSAFPVINRQTGFSAVAMLTADHCGSTGESWRSGQAASSNWSVGTLQSGNSGGSDIRRLGGASYEGSVYVGVYNSGQYNNVKGAYYPVKGDVVCPSGSYSGVNCRAEVQSTNDVICYFGGSCYNNLVTVKSVTTDPLFGNGDSGGPILVGAAGGGVLGVGVISGINTGGTNEKPCEGVASGGGRSCSVFGYFANVRAFFDNNSGWVPLTN
ncbi:hypothetical protein AB4Y63_17735 [Leifsonia sp. YAF41]|uniref:hypothetical protein n=1 Tax=Leifsonia sp. YAF41 TaxID=3233086 RepID=UPI003F957D3A